MPFRNSRGSSFRFGMVKLQPCENACEQESNAEFPLWHGKVATAAQARVGARPLTCFRFGMVKLQLGKDGHPKPRLLPSFRFGMVKLQLHRERLLPAHLHSFRFGMVKLQLKLQSSDLGAVLLFPLWHGKVATSRHICQICKSDLVSALAW